MKINDFNLEISEISIVSKNLKHVHSLMQMIDLNRYSNRSEWFIPDFILKSRTFRILINIFPFSEEFIIEKIYYEIEKIYYENL